MAEAWIDGDVQRTAELSPRAHQSKRVFRDGHQCREVMDAASRRLRLSAGDPLGPWAQAFEAHVAVARVETAGGVPERDLEAGQQRSVLDAHREHHTVAGRRPGGNQTASGQQLATAHQHHQPADQQRGQEGDREQIQLPRADDAGSHIHAGDDAEKGQTTGRRAGHHAPGTGTPSSSLAITAASVSPCILASEERMIL